MNASVYHPLYLDVKLKVSACSLKTVVVYNSLALTFYRQVLLRASIKCNTLH